MFEEISPFFKSRSDKKNKGKKLLNSEEWGAMLILLFVGLIGLMLSSNRHLLGVNNSFDQLFRDVSLTSQDQANQERSNCNSDETKRIFIENGKIIATTPQINCDLEVSAQEILSAIWDDEDTFNEEKRVPEKELFKEIGEYKIRSALNAQKELTGQIERVNPTEAHHAIDQIYLLKVNVTTFNESSHIYSLTANRNGDAWIITSVRKD